MKYTLTFESPEIKRCDECPFYSIAEYDGGYPVYRCSAADSCFDDDTDTRMTWCPLEKVKECEERCASCSFDRDNGSKKFYIDVAMEVPKQLANKSLWDYTVAEIEEMYKDLHPNCNKLEVFNNGDH